MSELFNYGGQTKAFAYTTTTSNAVLGGATGQEGKTIRLYNAGDQEAFVAFGIDGVTAVIPTGSTLGAIPLAPRVETGFALKGGQTHMAVISAAGTGTVYATLGNGI